MDFWKTNGFVIVPCCKECNYCDEINNGHQYQYFCLRAEEEGEAKEDCWVEVNGICNLYTDLLGE